MFSSEERLARRTPVEGVGRFEYLKQLVNEFATTNVISKYAVFSQKIQCILFQKLIKHSVALGTISHSSANVFSVETWLIFKTTILVFALFQI